MAGKDQHHIWQLLQRGFGERRGKDYHVWVYSKNQPARRTATRLFGVEKHFYGPEGSLADSNITKYENESQSTIQDIRKLPNGAAVDSAFAANLIAHLEIRSAFLREDSSRAMQKGMSELVRRFTSPRDLKEAISGYLKDNPDEVDKHLIKEFVPAKQRAGIHEVLQSVIKYMPEDEVLSAFRPGLSHIENFIAQFPEHMKESHNKVISENEDFPLRANLHLERRYSVLRLESGSFILPDTTLAFIKKGGASPFTDKGDSVECVVLPISHNVAIIGRTRADTDYPLKAINRILAGCSFKAFVARDRSPQLQGLTGRIGKYAKLISDRDLDRIVASAASSPQKPL